MQIYCPVADTATLEEASPPPSPSSSYSKAFPSSHQREKGEARMPGRQSDSQPRGGYCGCTPQEALLIAPRTRPTNSLSSRSQGSELSFFAEEIAPARRNISLSVKGLTLSFSRIWNRAFGLLRDFPFRAMVSGLTSVSFGRVFAFASFGFLFLVSPLWGLWIRTSERAILFWEVIGPQECPSWTRICL